jgi:2',3'-cyclic-nucleotide 2'-phosphodiesterase (5'-nucleotidase family)
MRLPVRSLFGSVALLALAPCAVACASSPTTGETGGARPGAPASDPRFPACVASAKTQRITFVHANDLHASYTPDAGGVSHHARLRAFYEKVKAENPYTIFTGGGDDYEKGSVAEQLSKGASTRAILHGLGFDVRVIGNHDFGWGQAEVLANARDPHAAVLTANVSYTGTDPGGFAAKPYVSLQVGCVSMGFLGLTSTPWDSRDDAVMADYFPDFPSNFLYPVVATPIIESHRDEVDLMVALTHVGTDVDFSLAEGVPGLDVVLGAHSHTLIDDPFAYGGPIPVIQAGAFAEYAARLDLDVDLIARKVTKVTYALQRLDDPALLPDPTVQALVESTLAKWAPEWNVAHGKAKSDASTASIAAIAARAMLAEMGTDAALVDVKTVWSTWKAGPVTQQACLDAFKVEREPPGTPGFNAAYRAKIDGANLQKLVALDPQKWAFVGPTTIDPTRTYTLALQKRPALNASEMPGGARVTEPTSHAEMWEVLDAYAKHRTASCTFLDVDEAIPGC